MTNSPLEVNGEHFVVMISEEEIRTRVKQLAGEISKDYEGRTPILIGVLNGSFIFFADLIREVSVQCEVDFLKLSSYGDAKISSGNVRILKELNCQIAGRDVIVVEDIVDSGLSIAYIKNLLMKENPKSFRIVSLLYKEESSRTPVHPEYVGFKIPRDFVIGYGLDYAQRMRNLKQIYRLANPTPAAEFTQRRGAAESDAR